ncbi:uncharacterized protein ARMOST_22656 [Armillaria ostoyae]|uniref:acetate--CoA ligase n=1 Tax=Armillaria ostoyae TaxID=47428 RepID=A0A284SDG4_ARMOS|nr:uncharacterized protein ARMOST_22656 [Armillaria ostoyae]
MSSEGPPVHSLYIWLDWQAKGRRSHYWRIPPMRSDDRQILSTTVFESTPVYPTRQDIGKPSKNTGLTQFYSAPTAIRLLRRLGAHHVDGHDLSTFRVLGSVGEPINPEAWNRYNEEVGKRQCAIVDTFWQTETGSIVVTPFPGAHGDQAWVAPPGKELEGNDVEGVLALSIPWPSIARTIYGDHKCVPRDVHEAVILACSLPVIELLGDEHGYIWIKGRIDDVINRVWSSSLHGRNRERSHHA